jgi:hypothetical protein
MEEKMVGEGNEIELAKEVLGLFYLKDYCQLF